MASRESSRPVSKCYRGKSRRRRCYRRLSIPGFDVCRERQVSPGRPARRHLLGEGDLPVYGAPHRPSRAGDQTARQSASSIEVYSDTDWAGCVRTRKSTSGGALMIGSHITKCRSSTQVSRRVRQVGGAKYYGTFQVLFRIIWAQGYICVFVASYDAVVARIN